MLRWLKYSFCDLKVGRLLVLNWCSCRRSSSICLLWTALSIFSTTLCTTLVLTPALMSDHWSSNGKIGNCTWPVCSFYTLLELNSPESRQYIVNWVFRENFFFLAMWFFGLTIILFSLRWSEDGRCVLGKGEHFCMLILQCVSFFRVYYIY